MIAIFVLNTILVLGYHDLLYQNIHNPTVIITFHIVQEANHQDRKKT